ncbi:RNA-dependent RNA polymerase [Steinernema ceratophorum partiti-like virus 1]|nr:RNA-dependent RNA polymerase [Steinernema ceratophorum partiti-like virus 1]
MLPLRDFHFERELRSNLEMRLYQIYKGDKEALTLAHNHISIRALYSSFKTERCLDITTKARQSIYERTRNQISDEVSTSNERFQFYRYNPRLVPPPNREPAPGITFIKSNFHTGRTTTASDQLPESGYHCPRRISNLMTWKYPQYLSIIRQYVRPIGTTDATFADYNREQVYCPRNDAALNDRIVKLISEYLDIKPYRPLHFIDTFRDDRPLSTGTAYHNRYSYTIKAHAKFCHPAIYAYKPTSKGYYTNAYSQYARRVIHNIKYTGLPFSEKETAQLKTVDHTISHLNRFMNSHPTRLYTRNHISPVKGPWKQRPVYAVDDKFLTIESMLAFPALVQSRKPTCAIMHGLETLRGGNVRLEEIACKGDYESFFTLDWSQFDQRLPHAITDTFFEDYLPSLIIVNHAYQPTYEYPAYPELSTESTATKIKNLLDFLQYWFNNMVYVTSDGYGYKRQFAGVPSGMFLTQFIDSYGNLYLIIDALIAFGCSDDEIRTIRLFIMGDDNSGFTHWPITKLAQFVDFFESYALKRWNMKLSASKSKISILRTEIETLSYRNQFGLPRRPIDKLLAQLCYPEYGPKPEYMSARAIGIAYAACGQDDTFHSFCRDVYNLYLDESVDVTDPTKRSNIIRHLPGIFRAFPEQSEILEFTRFPEISEIQQLVSYYHGELDVTPKWNLSHFTDRPDIPLENARTLKDFESENGPILTRLNELKKS